MKETKVVVMSFLTVVLATRLSSAFQSAPAQGGPNSQEVVAHLEKLATVLQPSPMQKRQILPILQQEAPQLQAVKNNPSLPPAKRLVELKQISNAADAKVQPILSPQQWQKWQEIRAEERQQMIQKLENQP